MTRIRPRFSHEMREWCDAVVAVVEKWEAYWPMTLRQIYYQLVKSLVIGNEPRNYKKLGDVLTRARLNGEVPWSAIYDPGRKEHGYHGFNDRDTFFAQETRNFLRGYGRNLMQSQDNRIEVWVEKEALASIVSGVASPFCISTFIARGYPSITVLNQCRQRINAAYNDHDQRTKILYFGDLDPSGMNMLPSTMETLKIEFELGSRVEGIRCALTMDQVHDFKLPRSPNALKDDAWAAKYGKPGQKKGDPRAIAYIKEHGRTAVELDALDPPVLEQVVRESILAHVDIDAYQTEIAQEKKDQQVIDKISKSDAFRKDVAKVIAKHEKSASK